MYDEDVAQPAGFSHAHGDGCITLAEFRDVMETDSAWFDSKFRDAAGADNCMSIEEWRHLVLKYKNDNWQHGRDDFFDRVYGGNCEYWTSWSAWWAGHSVPDYCKRDNFVEDTKNDTMSS